jgi:hypothetical protein
VWRIHPATGAVCAMPSLSIARRSWRDDRIFLPGLACLYAVTCFLIPPYFPLLQPDSQSYIEFSNTRRALYPLFLQFLRLGFDLVQITYVQIGLFSLALIVLPHHPDRITLLYGGGDRARRSDRLSLHR